MMNDITGLAWAWIAVGGFALAGLCFGLGWVLGSDTMYRRFEGFDPDHDRHPGGSRPKRPF